MAEPSTAFTRPLATWLRHLWLDAADSRRQLPGDALQRLEAAVRASEARHLGELRICVEAGLSLPRLWRGQSPRQRAIECFGLLRVWDTEHNNGVLIHLLLADRRIEVVADRGLSQRVPPETWQALTDHLGQALAQGQIEAGLQQAIAHVGDLLHAHFPAPVHAPNPNELPDAIVLI
jgi:uncharacterized membrane protein